MICNKYQSTPEQLNLDNYPEEIKEQFFDFINTVPYIKNLISENRPYAKDCPRDQDGKIIIDFTNPPIIEDTDYFRPTAIHFQKYGCITKLRPNRNPNSEYGKWIREEIRRCFYGYIRESDGAWITGDMYFFLNYCPIMKVKKVSGKKGIRVVDFPDFLEGQWLRFMYIQHARDNAKHGSELAARGKGKAHPYDEVVYTSEGLKNWEQVKIGDYLFGDDGNLTKIIDIPFDDVAPIYEVELSSGHRIKCSEGHLWKVQSHCRGEIIASTKELLDLYKRPRKIEPHNPKGYELDCTIPKGEGAEFPYQATKIDPYTFGLLLGDGCFRNPGYRNTVNLTAVNSDFEVYKNYIPYSYHKVPSGKYLYSLEIQDIHSILEEYGLNQKKSEDKFIPEEYKYNSKEVRIALLKGLLDADGTVSKGRIELTLSSKQMIEGVRWICASLGIPCSNLRIKKPWYYDKEGKRKHGLDAYRLSIFSSINLFNLPRKTEAWKSRSQTAYAQSKYKGYKITNITYCGEQKAKCVTVDNKSHCYLIGEFIPTHNSFSMASIAAKRFLLGELDETTGQPTKGVETFISSYFKTYLNDDGVLNKFEKYIDFCAEYTQFPKKRLTSSLDKMKWTSGYKESNSEIKKGSGNEVIGISVKDSPGKLRGKRGAFIGLEEMGCHIKGTEVLMYDTSIKKVEDIQVGDILMGDNGTPRKVLETHNGIDQLYKIILSNGDWHIVNSNHPIYYKKYSWGSKISQYKLATPIELLNRNLQGCYIPKTTINFPYKEVSINPYLLGLWLGDGDSSRISIANEDYEVLEWLANNSIGYIRDLKQSSTCKIFHLPSKNNEYLYSAFKKYNLFNNKHIPTDYIYNSQEIGLQLLAGLIDTDGNLSIKKHGQCFEITQHESRKHILDAAKFIATNCGLRCTISKRISNGKSKGNIHYRLRISGDIYKIPTKINRKQASQVSCKYKQRRCWTDYTFKVEPYDIGEYYGFTITDNHLFVLKDSTITHNSFPNLIELYSTLRPSMEDGDIVFGMIYAQGCVCAGTKVLQENGKPINIEDVSINAKLLGYNGSNSSVEDITWLQPYGEKECVRIITSKNNIIECSIDHPILALNKNKFNKSKNTCSFYRASEFRKGDTLLMPKQIGTFGNIHEKDAYLLGALFGDGSYSDNSCVTLSITTEEEYAYYNDKYDINISKLKYGYAQIYFRGLHPLLKKYKMDKQAFENKKLPYNIFDWDKESVCNFLGGYFNADGNIQIVKQKYRSIKLSCKYKNTLQEIKYLLYKLGITSHIYKESKPSRILNSKVNNKCYKMSATDIYVLYISNSEDIHTFKQCIRFLIKNKQERLDSYNLHYSKHTYNSLKFELRSNHKGQNFIGKTFDNLQAVTIKNIENIGIQRIYNMTANTTHTYISNGFISSNTAGDKDSDFSAAQKIMYSPRAFNMQPIKNVYDKVGQGKPEFVYFYPAYVNRNGCYNKDGVSDVTKAILEILINRYNVKYNTTDATLITKTIAEHPIVPQEAVLRTRGNLFPASQINERLNQIDANPNIFDDVYVGELIFDKAGQVKYVPSDDVPIRVYPTEDNKDRGAIEFYEMPQKNREGKVFPNRYIIGHDPKQLMGLIIVIL